MATAAKIKAILQTALAGDDERLYVVAMQLAAEEARKGHGKFAQDIKELIDAAKSKKSSVRRTGGIIPMVRPKGDLSSLFTVKYPDELLSDMVLDNPTKQKLKKVITEQRQRHKILAYGLSPRSKLLLIGPPGSGKTMTASALAGELNVPLFTIRLESVITKFMGETASKLRLVFDSILETRGVYLFDEFDALGGKRDAGNDIGEIRRVLNSFLQFLEEETPNSLVLAATNYPDLLDPALFRRFDDVIHYKMPDGKLAIKVLRSKLASLDTQKVEWDALVKSCQGLSHSELVRAAENALKDAILNDKSSICTKDIIMALDARHITS